MAAGTLGTIHWAEHAHAIATARTMGMVVFSLFNLFFSIESRDSRESAFSLRTFADRTFMATTGVSFLLIVLSTLAQPFQAILRTRALDERQWLLCLVVALSIVVVCEIGKALPRHRHG
jgi:Ca2+-transporting ATPase